MLSLDQVRLLENRVEKAVGKIRLLESENEKLRGQFAAFQSRIGELEGLVRAFKDDQGRIEEGILNALDRLSAFEDSVFAETESIAASIVDAGTQTEPFDEETDFSADSDIEAGQGSTETAYSDFSEEEIKSAPEVNSDGQMDIF